MSVFYCSIDFVAQCIVYSTSFAYPRDPCGPIGHMGTFSKGCRWFPLGNNHFALARNGISKGIDSIRRSNVIKSNQFRTEFRVYSYHRRRKRIWSSMTCRRTRTNSEVEWHDQRGWQRGQYQVRVDSPAVFVVAVFPGRHCSYRLIWTICFHANGKRSIKRSLQMSELLPCCQRRRSVFFCFFSGGGE